MILPRRGAFALLVTAVILASIALPAQAGVEKTDRGIRFTYYDPEAGKVSLAGTFNGWNDSATPMTKLESGEWEAYVDLGPGEHEYKFVVDGAWITDFDNPDTKPDPYGGVNSVVNINSQGDIVVSGAGDRLANTALNPRIRFDGFFLFSARTLKDYDEDRRWRLYRPRHAFDLNSTITINEQVEGYARLRTDSETNLLQVNNVSAWLNEAHILVTPPGVFDLRGYYNMEVLQSRDPLGLAGDVDLAGTIFDDHLEDGKGTAGAVFSTVRLGIDWHAFAANVHDFDIYNDPNLYDNTGTDRIHARGSRSLGPVRVGANFFLDRDLWWLDMTSLVGTTPANTGIPALDEHIDRTGDPSDWYEFEGSTWYAGADAGLDLLDGELRPRIEYLAGKSTQGFVTSNNSGIDFGNSPIDVRILDRDADIIHGGISWTQIEHLYVNTEHTTYRLRNAGEDETILMPEFRTDAEANKLIYFTVDGSPPDFRRDYSELELRWAEESLDARLWLQRDDREWDRPEGAADYWHYTLSVSPGISFNLFGDLDLDLSAQYTDYDISSTQGGYMDAVTGSGFTGSSVETILRGSYGLTGNVRAIADVRIINYSLDAPPEGYGDSETFTAPFVGFEYAFLQRADLVLAYGVDPLDFRIDYDGRHIGRWNFRNEYMWENEGATMIDAEKALADRQVITLRATFRF